MRLCRLAAAGASFALVACDQGESARGPGGETAVEARALDEAAEMIEQRRLPPTALRASAAPPTDAAQASESP